MRYDLDNLKARGNAHAYFLAGDAGCACDNDEAAQLLIAISDTLIEQTDDIDAEDWQRVMLDNGDIINQIAGNSASDYTHTRWQEFVGTAAWREDFSDRGGMPSDMTEAAAVALEQIAQRLAYAVARDIQQHITDAEVAV